MKKNPKKTKKQKTNRQMEKTKLSKTRWQQNKTTIDLCNCSIGQHELLEERREGNISMRMKTIQKLGTSKHQRLLKRVFGVK